MFDPTNSDDIQQYEHELIEDAKANPKIGVGMPVEVYAYDDPCCKIGEGIVMSVAWSGFYCQHYADVRGVDCVWPCVLAGCLEPIRTQYWVRGVIGNG